MQISAYAAAQSMGQATGPGRLDSVNSVRGAQGTGRASFEQAIDKLAREGDQVTLSAAAKASPEAGNKQATELSASEKSFFNDSFGMNVFGGETVKGPVVSPQAASVLDSQEISFFQSAFGSTAQSASSYTRGGGYGRAYGQQAVQAGQSLNRSV